MKLIAPWLVKTVYKLARQFYWKTKLKTWYFSSLKYRIPRPWIRK